MFLQPYRFHSEKHFYTPQPRRRSWFNHESTPVIRKKSFGICEDDVGANDDNGWLSNIHSASSSRSASLANSSIAQVFFNRTHYCWKSLARYNQSLELLQYFSRRKSFACTGDADGCYSGSISQRTSMQHDSPPLSSRAGVVITSSRQSKRRWTLCLCFKPTTVWWVLCYLKKRGTNSTHRNYSKFIIKYRSCAQYIIL